MRAGVVIHHVITARQCAVLRGFADEFVHAGDAAFVEQIHDQFQFVQAFVIGHFGLIAGFHQGFPTGLHQFGGTAAQHRLFAEQIGFGFFLEAGLDCVLTRTANAGAVSQCQLLGLAALVLMHRIHRRHTTADFIFTAHQSTRALGCDQHHVEVFARADLPVMHVEAVRKQQAGTLGHVRLQHFAIQLRLHHVGGEHGNDLGVFHRLGRGFHGEAIGLGLDLGGAARAQAHGDIEAGITQVEGMGAALATVTDDGDAGFVAGHCGGSCWERLVKTQNQKPRTFRCGVFDFGVVCLLLTRRIVPQMWAK